MNSEIRSEPPIPSPEAPVYSVPWKFMDNWVAVVLLALIDVALFLLLQDSRTEFAQSAAIVLLELAYLLPVILILAWRRVHWKSLGFGRFDWQTVGLGCGLLVGAYAIIAVHNILLYYLGVDTQGQEVLKMFAELDTPVWFAIVAVVVAPFVEEIFFRGFLFQGLRQKYGWIAGLLVSSTIFAMAHLDPVALIPTFILGMALAYVYHRSNSVWPGIFLHFLVNGFGVCAAYAATYLQNSIPV